MCQPEAFVNANRFYRYQLAVDKGPWVKMSCHLVDKSCRVACDLPAWIYMCMHAHITTPILYVVIYHKWLKPDWQQVHVTHWNEGIECEEFILLRIQHLHTVFWVFPHKRRILQWMGCCDIIIHTTCHAHMLCDDHTSSQRWKDRPNKVRKESWQRFNCLTRNRLRWSSWTHVKYQAWLHFSYFPRQTGYPIPRCVEELADTRNRLTWSSWTHWN